MTVADQRVATVPTDDLFLALYCVVDELYREVAPDWVKCRPNARCLKMSDSEIITLSVMQEGRSNDSELSFHRRVQVDYAHLFPDPVSRSRTTAGATTAGARRSWVSSAGCCAS